MSPYQMASIYWQEVDFSFFIYFLAMRLASLEFSYVMVEKIQISLFLRKDGGLNKIGNVITDHVYLKNDYEINKKSTVLKLSPQIFK